ncbi:hypothetical protein SAMN04487936_103299 [Halobacillus dabanensis]|uniref:Uncharacterized protein n=1 Tax=Halobacillus dabanensis TaxID=240302 RepID=A0A1I3TBE6_HALDA|nr:hypothetical protein [Halobacillus dabanensis]SFJ67863.1 hypothetical protein SAMN04487936_103299 [Halobacillus dabanensis]
MKLFANILTAIISPIVLAIAINVFITPEGVDLSLVVFIYSLPVFLIIGIPVSILIKQMTKKMDRVWKRFLTEILLFTIAGLGVGGVFVWSASLDTGDYQPILLLMTGSSLLYYFILTVTMYAKRLDKEFAERK